MAKLKKPKVEETIVSEEETMIESPEKADFRELIEKYKEQNPVKYEQKKADLEAKLNAMK
jgi:hypothetical protein